MTRTGHPPSHRRPRGHPRGLCVACRPQSQVVCQGVYDDNPSSGVPPVCPSLNAHGSRRMARLKQGGANLMGEQELPPSVLNKATVRGNEYAWPLSAVEEAVAAARACGLADLGGQAQFRIPEGICELYWLAADSSARLPGEPWEGYVNRSADEVLARFADLRRRTCFLQEG